MTIPEIPEEAVEAACRSWNAPHVGVVSDRMRSALTAALPHLRVQETPPWEGITSREPEGEALEQMRKWYADQDLPGPPSHPRPVVDREALLELLELHKVFTWMPMSTKALDAGRSSLATAVLALLPTEEAAVYVVHHHDIEKHAASFNEGYEEAQRQRIGGEESRNWLTEKVWPLLKDHIDPENSHHVADQIADALLSEADLSDLPTEEGEGS